MHPKSFQVPSCSADWSFFPRTIRDWNNLPSDIIYAGSLDAFKARGQILFWSSFKYSFNFFNYHCKYFRLYSVLSPTLKLEHHSREIGWRMSGVGLTRVWVEFSIGIHYLHSSFPHLSDDTRKCINPQRSIVSPTLKKTLVWKCWHCTKIFWIVKKLIFEVLINRVQ